MAGSDRRRAEVVARWREAGAWWAGEPPREHAEWRDRYGALKKASREIRYKSEEARGDVRPRKTRDEKVAAANGFKIESWKIGVRASPVAYAPLHVLSGYSFGRSVLLARELPRRAASLGIRAMALTDRFALTGAVEFSRECRECGVRPLVGTTVELPEGGEVVLLARDKEGYKSLSRLLTECHLHEPRLYPLCTWERLETHAHGVLCLTGGDGGPLTRSLLQGRYDDARAVLERLVRLYGREFVWVEIERSYLPWGIALEKRLTQLAEAVGVRCVAGGAVTHPTQHHFPAQDVLACSESLCTVEEVVGRKPPRHPSQPQTKPSPLRAVNAERYLHSPEEAQALFRDRPELIEGTMRVADMCQDDVLPERTRLPQVFEDSASALRQITLAGAESRHKKVTPALRNRLDHELGRIVRMGFADHFLTAWDFCNWAASQGYLFSGRGSVVDSAVAYCLGFSRIDAFAHRLHFDRFLTEDGDKRPDIDIDFEARHRDDVRNYIIGKYGADRVATVSAIGAFNTRGIVREVGKALGVAPEVVGYLAKRLHGGVSPRRLEESLESRPELRESRIDKNKLHWMFALGEMLCDVPRNIRAHSSGVVLSDVPLCETVPVQWSGGLQDDGVQEQNLRIIQWDKRSAKHYFDKFDVLCLRGQDVLAGTEDRVRLADSGFRVEGLPLNDVETYRAMQSGELIGVPQSASPAMRQAHMRLRTADLHDASLVQAGIRPGVGGAVKINELIARRRGKPYTFDHPDLEAILGHTYGIVIFQEQIDQLLSVFAGYTAGVAEEIRDKIYKCKTGDYGEVIKDELLARMRARGYSEDVSRQAFELIAGFKGYGFAQGHALAFAEISVRSIWCQQNYPAEYFAALLDAQPAGYYGPCTLVNEARLRGVRILPVDVNASGERFQVEDVRSSSPGLVVPNGGIRLSLACVMGLSSETRKRIVCRDREDGFRTLFDFCRSVRPDQNELEALVLCGAFDTLCPNRRALMWAVPDAMRDMRATEGLLGLEVPEPTLDLAIEDFSAAEKLMHERRLLGLDVERHLMAYERARVSAKGAVTADDAKRMPPGRKAIVVGNPIRLRFPPTPSGKRVVFFDLEDETGLLNVTCFDRTYQRFGHAFVCNPYVTLIGRTQWRDGCTAFLLDQAYGYRPVIETEVRDMPVPMRPADFLVG
jgi:error-prone DNA polymerase